MSYDAFNKVLLSCVILSLYLDGNLGDHRFIYCRCEVEGGVELTQFKSRGI